MTLGVIDIPFDPVFHIGIIPVHWYGIGYVVAFMVGLWIAFRHARRHGIPDGDMQNLAFWGIILGLISARLYYDFQSGAGYYLTHPQYLLAFWQGGMAYFGALLVVPIFFFLYARRRGLRFWVLADCGALFAAAGQPIGRIGNIINGDILGYPSNLPWATAYTNPNTFAPRVGVAYQPAGAYELLIGICILLIILGVRRYLRLRPGGLIVLYAALYSVSQFGIFFIRANSVTLFGLKQAQLSSLFTLVVLVPITWWWYRTSKADDGRKDGAEAGALAGVEAAEQS